MLEGLQVDFRKFSVWTQDFEIGYIGVFTQKEYDYGDQIFF